MKYETHRSVRRPKRLPSIWARFTDTIQLFRRTRPCPDGAGSLQAADHWESLLEMSPWIAISEPGALIVARLRPEPSKPVRTHVRSLRRGGEIMATGAHQHRRVHGVERMSAPARALDGGQRSATETTEITRRTHP